MSNRDHKLPENENSSRDRKDPSNPKKKRKKQKIMSIRLAISLGILLIFAGAFIRLFTPWLGDPIFTIPGFTFFTNTETTASHIQLVDIEELLSIQSAEAVYKVVFPHDFIPEGLSYSRIASNSASSFVRQVYNLSLISGIDPGPNANEFIVVTVILSAGIDFKDHQWNNNQVDHEAIMVPPPHSETSPSSVASPSSIDSEDELPGLYSPDSSQDSSPDSITINSDLDALSVELHLPKVEILETRIEDPHSRNYGYPDRNISPAQWKEISTFILGNLHRISDTDDLLILAENKISALLETVFISLGFTSISIEYY